MFALSRGPTASASSMLPELDCETSRRDPHRRSDPARHGRRLPEPKLATMAATSHIPSSPAQIQRAGARDEVDATTNEMEKETEPTTLRRT